jgi:hypothetical protein
MFSKSKSKSAKLAEIEALHIRIKDLRFQLEARVHKEERARRRLLETVIDGLDLVAYRNIDSDGGVTFDIATLTDDLNLAAARTRDQRASDIAALNEAQALERLWETPAAEDAPDNVTPIFAGGGDAA